VNENDLESFKNQKLLIGVTGSIAVFSLPSYFVSFKQLFKEVAIVMTPSAEQFISATSFKNICQYAYTDSSLNPTNHIELARWPDRFIILPATANTLFKSAYGQADNLLSLCILSYEKTIHFFPNMNLAMWNQKCVQRNIQQLILDEHFVCPLNEQLAFEQASGTMKKNCVIPSVEQILFYLLTHPTKARLT